jgi:hypothetical protein
MRQNPADLGGEWDRILQTSGKALSISYYYQRTYSPKKVLKYRYLV